MRPEKLALGRSRRCSLAGRIREKIKRFLSVAVSVSVITCSMPAIPAMAATDDDDVQEFTLTVNDLCDAVETALKGGESISESAYVFKGDAQETYEDLFYGADVYEIEPEFEKSGSNDLSLKVFVRLGADREIDSDEITGEEEIVFLLLNRSDEEATARIMIDGYETGLITVAPKGDVAAEEVELEETGISTLSASAGGSAEDGSEETADEEAADEEDTDEAGEADADAEEAHEGSAEEEKPDDSKAAAPEDKDPKDKESEKPDDHRADDKGKDHEAGKESDSGDKDAEKPGSDDKADHNESKDKGYGDFTGGSHDKGDKADGNDGSADKADKSNSADKADSSDSKDDGDKAETKDNSSARASRSSRNSNYLKAALGDAEDDAEEDDKAETEDADIDDTPEIIIEIDEEDEELAASIDEGEDEASIVSLAAYEEVEDDDETASASDAKEAKDGYILIEGETYEPVVVNHSRSGVAYETTLQNLGIDYGIMLLASPSNAVYLNGTSGNDSADGDTAENAVQTFAKAKELAEENDITTIYVTGSITVTDEETWDGSITIKGNEENLVICRAESFTSDDLIIVGDNSDLTLKNITIDDNKISEAYALIKVNGTDAVLTIEDGTVIKNNYEPSNQLNGGEQGAVYVTNGNFIMNGGEIKDNSNGFGGGGVAIVANSPESAEMLFNGGTISDNSAMVGGGIYLAGNSAKLTMYNGAVENNTATNNGGGIYVGSGSEAYIYGGSISYNKQTQRENYGGGGVYSNSGQAINGVQCGPGHAYIYNVEIAENSITTKNEDYLDIYNATIASCETGSVEVNVTDGQVIHDNEDGYTFFVYMDSDSSIFTLSPIMLGGGVYNWEDAYGNLLSLDGITFNSAGWHYAKTEVSTEDGSVTGLDRCYTKIIGNEAVVMGSAIGTNGYVTIGKSDGDVTITITKVWDGVEENDIPEEVTVHVYATDGHGERVDIGQQTLTAENEWKVAIEHLPKYDYYEDEFEYYIVEEGTGNFVGVVSGGKTSSSGDEYDADEKKTAEYEFIITNGPRKYFEIDEEIVPDEDNTDTWTRSKSVDEFSSIEFEMSTNLPVVSVEDVANGDFTMLFHNELDTGLRVDSEETADLHITIGGQTIPEEFYDVEVFSSDIWTISTYAAETDNCAFHVTVDISKLYNSDYNKENNILSESSFNGNTQITVFFFADLEDMGMDGIYKSTVYYQLYDSDDLLHTSDPVSVEVYTYEIGVSKIDSDTGDLLAGATFGLYYDEACTEPVIWHGEQYILTSDKDGNITFYGLAAGTYYMKEISAPEGYELVDDIFVITLGGEDVTIVNHKDAYRTELSIGNTPTTSGGTHHSSGGGGGGGSSSGSSGASGSVVGGPGSGDSGAGDGENYYPLDTMPQTGDPGATKSLFMMILGFGALLVISVVDRKKKKIMD